MSEAFELLPPDGHLFNRDLFVDTSSPRRRADYLAGSWIAGYSNQRTRTAYRLGLRQWFVFLHELGVTDPIEHVQRGHGDVYARHLETRGLMAATVYRKLSILTTFYEYLVGEEYLLRNPFARVARPTLPRESTREWLGARETHSFLHVAEKMAGYPYALCCLLALNGLRVSEACGANIEGLGFDRDHRTLLIVGKGNQPNRIALARKTRYAVEQAIGKRTSGPLLLNRTGTRMQRDAAGRIVRNVVQAAGVDKRITPHSLRHTAITLHYKAKRDVHSSQRFARHADVRTTLMYTHDEDRLDSHGTYVVETFLAGAD